MLAAKGVCAHSELKGRTVRAHKIRNKYTRRIIIVSSPACHNPRKSSPITPQRAPHISPSVGEMWATRTPTLRVFFQRAYKPPKNKVRGHDRQEKRNQKFVFLRPVSKIAKPSSDP